MRDLEKVMERLDLMNMFLYQNLINCRARQQRQVMLLIMVYADLRRMNNKKICKYLYRNSV